MKDLKNYRDYKLYLKDVYKTKSEKHTRFSFAVWAKSLGISSPSLLSMVINGNRHPSKKLAERLSVYLNHSVEESEYFRGLIELNKASLNPHLSVNLNTNLLNSDLNSISVKVDKYEEAKILLEEFKGKMSELLDTDSINLDDLNIMIGKTQTIDNIGHINL